VIAVRAIRGRYGEGTPAIGLNYTRGLLPGMLDEQYHEEQKRFNALNALQWKPDAYARECRQLPFYTIVVALPRDTELTRHLVDADYILKRAGNGGTSELKVKDPNPMMVWNLARAKELDGTVSQVEKDAMDVMRHSYGMMMFKPGRMSYVRSP
jgi:hypothetical protein